MVRGSCWVTGSTAGSTPCVSVFLYPISRPMKRPLKMGTLNLEAIHVEALCTSPSVSIPLFPFFIWFSHLKSQAWCFSPTVHWPGGACGAWMLHQGGGEDGRREGYEERRRGIDEEGRRGGDEYGKRGEERKVEKWRRARFSAD